MSGVSRREEPHPKEVEELRKFTEELAREIEEMKQSRGAFGEAFVNYVEKTILGGEHRPQQTQGRSCLDQAIEQE